MTISHQNLSHITYIWHLQLVACALEPVYVVALVVNMEDHVWDISHVEPTSPAFQRQLALLASCKILTTA